MIGSDISAADAMKIARANKSRKFPGREDDRFRGDWLFPYVQPSFQIAENSAVFTIGSCFARNIEEALAKSGVRVPSLDFQTPLEEQPAGRPNAILNQYNSGTMCEIVEMALETGKMEGGLYQKGNGLYVDRLVNSAAAPVTYERALERRRQILDLYQMGIKQSDTVIVTLGLTETWRDAKDGVFLNGAPPLPLMNSEPERFKFRRQSVDDCLKLMLRMFEMLQADKPRNIIVTVSPVPFGSTFSSLDPQVANMMSKSTLRVVAEHLSEAHANVDYFPSYEMVMSGGIRSFNVDNVHVLSPVVHDIVQYMLGRYIRAGDG